MIERSHRRAFAVLSAGAVVLSLASAVFAFTENAYRWRNDDGSEAAASFTGAENAALPAAPVGVKRRLRFGAANSGSESEFLRKAAIIGKIGDHGYWSAVTDTAAGFAYFGTN